MDWHSSQGNGIFRRSVGTNVTEYYLWHVQHGSPFSVLHHGKITVPLLLLPQDTDVIVWDVINESGLYRLRGHKDAVTQALFLKERNLLITRYPENTKEGPLHTHRGLTSPTPDTWDKGVQCLTFGSQLQPK